MIDVREDAGPPCRHVTDLLSAHAVDLDRRIAELTALRDEVHRLLKRAPGLDAGACGAEAVCHVIPRGAGERSLRR